MTPNSHPSTLKFRFASKFVKSLGKMKNEKPDSSPGSNDAIRKRSQKIKLAAYSSMARVIGTRRAWSRALIIKIRNRAIHRHVSRKKPKTCSKRRGVSRNGKICRRRKPGRVNELRRLVPGGEAMDLCSLLEETAHFVKCLSTQVKVMQSIVDHYSS